MARKPNLKNVAEKAGVSVITASRAIRGIGRVNRETRNKVLEAAEAIGYKRHSGQVFAGFGNASPSDHCLRLLLPYFTSNKESKGSMLESRIVQGIQESLEKVGGILSIVDANDVDDMIATKLPRAKTHGIVLRQVLPDSWLHKLQAIAPIVYAISHDVQPNVDCVYFNEFKSATMLYDHMIAKGHQHIASVTFDRSNPIGYIDQNNYDMSSGFDRQAFNFTLARNAAWNALDLGIRENRIHHDKIALNLPLDKAEQQIDEVQAGRDAANAILALPELPTAIVITSDDIAEHTKRHLEASGINFPEDMSIVTYLSSSLAVRMQTKITGIRLPFGQVGKIIPEIIQRRITNPDSTYISVALQTELIDRGTVSRPRGQ